MGVPGSCGQLTIVLKNAELSETAVASDRESGPSHACDDGVCTMIFECGWMRAWRANRGTKQHAGERGK